MLTAEYSGLASTYNKLGHHGLFADRLDANYTQPTLLPGFVSCTHLPARIVYQVRNRTYDPSTQRWLQRDPNATGQVVLGWSFHHGQNPAILESDIVLERMYSDGMTLFGYSELSPIDGVDSLGLFSIAIAPGEVAARMKMAYQAYDTGKKVFDLAKSLVAGVGWQQAMIGFAAEMLFDKYGGKLLDTKILALGGDALRGAAKISGYAWHHVFPKFLNGGKDGIVALLKKELHEKFHGKLFSELANAGIKLSGQQGDTWERLFIDNPGLRDKAVEVLRRVTQGFDAEHGTHLFEAMMEETMKAGF